MSKACEIGKIVNTRGLKGEVKVYPYVDDLDTFSKISYIIVDGEKKEITGRKYFKNMAFLTLAGIDTVEKAELLKNKSCFVNEKDLPELDDGEYYVKDIIGLEVYTEDGEYKGVIKNVEKPGGNDVYEVVLDGRRPLYLPAIKDVIKSVDIDGGKMTVKILDGLEDL